MSKGRLARIVTPPTKPKRAELPIRDLLLNDGRLLVYVGKHTIAQVLMGCWKSADGLVVTASMDSTPHGRLLHVAMSYTDRDPSWDEIKAVRYAFYPRDVDVAMMLPQDKDYVNIHTYCFQMWETPVEWGLR